MRISDAMWRKAQKMVGEVCAALYSEANLKRGRKRHKPYSTTKWVDDVVSAMGRDDAETLAALLLFSERKFD
jgi:hypothetical protein